LEIVEERQRQKNIPRRNDKKESKCKGKSGIEGGIKTVGLRESFSERMSKRVQNI
jgi:hypothetical protein